MYKQNARRYAIASLFAAASVLVATAAQATTINLSYAGQNGYTAVGSFTYDGATAPTIINEANGATTTNTVQSFNISFYDPAHMLIESGSSVINGVSSDRFFRLTYNTATNSITALDADIGGSYVYFLSNLRTPTGSVVAAGQTTFNFFDRATANAALDVSPSVLTTVAATSVPEPASWLGLLGGLVAVLGLGRFRYRRNPAASLS